MKTAKEWFLEILPIELSSLAINNSHEYLLNLTFDSFHESLAACFVWDKSPQGHNFWSEIHQTHLIIND